MKLMFNIKILDFKGKLAQISFNFSRKVGAFKIFCLFSQKFESHIFVGKIEP